MAASALAFATGAAAEQGYTTPAQIFAGGISNFLATIGLGFVNRTAPQLNVFFLSMPVKSALGIAMLVLYLPFIMDMLMYTREAALLDPLRQLIGQ